MPAGQIEGTGLSMGADASGAFPQKRERIGKGRPPKHSQFKPGNRANPGGRPKGLVRKIRELTKDGVALATWMHEVWQGKIRPTNDQFRAATWLAEHGFGRPTQLEMPPAVDRPPMVFMFTRPLDYDPLADPAKVGMAKALPRGQTAEAPSSVVIPGIGDVKDLEAVDPDSITPLPDPPRRWPG